MITKELVEYIKTERDRGVSEVKLKEALLEAGWPAEAVEAGFSEVEPGAASEEAEVAQAGEADSAGSPDALAEAQSAEGEETGSATGATTEKTESGPTEGESVEKAEPVAEETETETATGEESISSELPAEDQSAAAMGQPGTNQELSEKPVNTGEGESEPEQAGPESGLDKPEPEPSIKDESEADPETSADEAVLAESESGLSAQTTETAETEPLKDEIESEAESEVTEPAPAPGEGMSGESEVPTPAGAKPLATDRADQAEAGGGVFNPASALSGDQESEQLVATESPSSTGGFKWAWLAVAVLVALLLGAGAVLGYILWDDLAESDPEEQFVSALFNLSQVSSLGYDYSIEAEVEGPDLGQAGGSLVLSGAGSVGRPLIDLEHGLTANVEGHYQDPGGGMEATAEGQVEARVVDQKLYVQVLQIPQFMAEELPFPTEQWMSFDLSQTLGRELKDDNLNWEEMTASQVLLAGILGEFLGDREIALELTDELDYRRMVEDYFALSFKHDLINLEPGSDEDLNGQTLNIYKISTSYDPDDHKAFWNDYREVIKDYDFLPPEMRELFLSMIEGVVERGMEKELEEVDAIGDMYKVEIGIGKDDDLPHLYRVVLDIDMQELEDLDVATEEGGDWLNQTLTAFSLGGYSHGLIDEKKEESIEEPEQVEVSDRKLAQGEFTEVPPEIPGAPFSSGMLPGLEDMEIELELRLELSDFDQPIDINPPDEAKPFEEVAGGSFLGRGSMMADDASIESDISSVRAATSLYGLDNDGYRGLCTNDTETRKLIQSSLDKLTGYPDADPTDHCLVDETGDSWLVIVPLNDPEVEGWCVDHTGRMTEVAARRPDPTVGYSCELY